MHTATNDTVSILFVTRPERAPGIGPGNANLPIGVAQIANREIGVPGIIPGVLPRAGILPAVGVTARSSFQAMETAKNRFMSYPPIP
jgi:hypothetical protein